MVQGMYRGQFSNGPFFFRVLGLNKSCRTVLGDLKRDPN